MCAWLERHVAHFSIFLLFHQECLPWTLWCRHLFFHYVTSKNETLAVGMTLSGVFSDRSLRVLNRFGRLVDVMDMPIKSFSLLGVRVAIGVVEPRVDTCVGRLSGPHAGDRYRNCVAWSPVRRLLLSSARGTLFPTNSKEFVVS